MTDDIALLTNDMDVRISPENIITKSNLLIDSNYRLSTLESKLVATLFSNVQPTDQDFNTYVFPIKEFTEFLELKGKSKYKDLRMITKNLMETVFEINIEDDIHQVSWLSYAKYNDRKGTITLRFDPFWKPYILHLKKNFTSYKLGNIKNLNSSYSIRLYELLKQRQGLKKRIFSLQELREKLGVEDGLYPKYANFKQRVLLTAQKELREESDIYFDFVEIKKGRAVAKIEFFIHHNSYFSLPSGSSPGGSILGEPKETEQVQTELCSYGISKIDAMQLMKLFPVERINANILYTKERIRKGAVHRSAPYLKRAIEQDYANTKNTTIFPVKRDELPESWSSPINIVSPVEKENILLDARTLMVELERTEESIYKDLSKILKKYKREYEEAYERPLETNEFTHPIIKKLYQEIMLQMEE